MLTQLQNIVKTPTNDVQRKVLILNGFFHVSGLPTRRRWARTIEEISTQERPHIIGEGLTIHEVGRTGYNNGVSVIVTTGGETWLR